MTSRTVDTFRSASSGCAEASTSCLSAMQRADYLYLGAFVLANLGLRLALLGLNEAEYTDGILQLTVFQNKAGLYPPLYGALAHAFGNVLSLVPPDDAVSRAEWGGRLISALASALALVPVYLLTVRLAPPCAARFAALFYTVCPLVLRWSIRVMTDALFLCTSAFAIWALLEAYDQHRSSRRADRWLALASVLGAASALTRYQGALFIVLLLIEIAIFVARWRTLPRRTLLASFLWILLPLWIVSHGFVHQAQFSQRTTGQWLTTLLAWLNLAESFTLIFPYYLGWPIFLFALLGFMRIDWHSPSRRHFLFLWALWGGMLLALQSVFGSFQYRYLMPVFPAAIAMAGAGASHLEFKCLAANRRWAFSALLVVALAYLVLFSSAVLIFQRQAFGDQRSAARFLQTQVPRETKVIANERYGNFLALGCVKLSYWSHRPVESLLDYLPARPASPPPKWIPPGSYVVLGNAYGGDEFVDFLAAFLTYYYHMRYAASFDATVYPLMDDIMVDPRFNQNPLGWVMRYTPQLFSTHVYIVDRPRTAEELRGLEQRQLRIPVDPTASPKQTQQVQQSDATITDTK